MSDFRQEISPRLMLSMLTLVAISAIPPVLYANGSRASWVVHLLSSATATLCFVVAVALFGAIVHDLLRRVGLIAEDPFASQGELDKDRTIARLGRLVLADLALIAAVAFDVLR